MSTNKNSTPSSLYHYTTSEVVTILFNEILNNNYNELRNPMLRFHASEAHFMNDKNENGLIINNLYLKSKELTNRFESFRNKLNKVFVLSLGKSRDCLPMWLIYGNTGSGISLRFDFKQLKNSFKVVSLKDIDTKKRNDEVLLIECNYLSNNNILQYAKSYRNNLKNALNLGKTDYELIEMFNDIQIKSMSLKYNYFNYETEYRLLKQSKNVLLKNGRYGITLYQIIEIPLCAIKEILIGPMCNYDTTIEAVNALSKKIYDKFGIEIKVTKSLINIK